MRIEVAIPDNRHSAAEQLADELGLTMSQLVDEALSLFHKAVLETRRGRRLLTIDPTSRQVAGEIATPTLSALQWAFKPEQLKLPADTLAQMRSSTETARPSARLRAAAKRHGK